MTTVLISGWKVGFQKVKFTQLLQTGLGYSLSNAKRLTDSILDGKIVELQVSATDANLMLVEMGRLGAKCATAVSMAS